VPDSEQWLKSSLSQVRHYWVDHLKAIAIILVVLGHFQGLNSELKQWIYSFHIPVFLFVTGFLTGHRLKAPALKPIFERYLLPYCKLYLLLSLVSISFWYLNLPVQTSLLSLIEPLSGMLYGVQGQQRLLIHLNGPLWYFPFLISSTFFAYLAYKLKHWGFVICVIYTLFAEFLLPDDPPWRVDMMGIGAFFILLGVYFNQHQAQLMPPHNKVAACFISILTGLLSYWLASQNGLTNLSRGIWGQSLPVFLITASLGIYSLISITSKCPSLQITQLLSQNSLIIFASHIYFVKTINTTIEMSGFIGFPSQVIYSLLITLICLCFAMVTQPFVKRITT